MATMWYKNVNCAVVYVDPAATGANTGATPADAKTTLPTPSAMTGGTVYLLRRGLVTAAVYTLGMTTCAQDSVAIWAMPLSTDENYVMVPAEVKTAWDADAATLPRLQIVSQTTGVPTFSGFGFSLHRVNLTISFSTGVANRGYLFANFTGDCVSFTKVKSQYAGFDLAVASSLTGSCSTSTLMFTGRSVRLADCEFQVPGWIDFASGYANAQEYLSDCAVFLRNRDGFHIVENCTFRCAGSYYYEYGSPLYSLRMISRVAVVRNTTFDLIDYRGNGTYRNYRAAYKMSAKVVRINDLTVTTRVLGSQSPGVPSGNYVYDANLYGQLGTYTHLLCVHTGSTDTTYNPDDTTYHVDWIIDGVTIDGSGYQYAPGGMAFNPPGNYGLDPRGGRLSVRNYTFNASQASRYDDRVVGIAVPTNCNVVVENCTINYAATSAIAFQSGTNAPGAYQDYNSAKPTFRNCAGSGRILIDSVRYAEFTSFAVVATDVANPIMCGGGIYYIGTLTFPAGWGASQMISAANRAQIFVNSCNLSVIPAIGSSPSVQQSLTVANNGAAGAWGGWHPWMYVKSSSIYRTGGALAALYFHMNTVSYSSRYCGVWLSPRPFAAKAVSPGSTGLRRLTLYIASKGPTADVTYRSILVEVTAPSGGSGTKLFTSMGSGRLEADSSTWNNDTGITAYRLVIMVAVDRLEDLGVRIAFLPFSSTTQYIYIDPKIDVSA